MCIDGVVSKFLTACKNMSHWEIIWKGNIHVWKESFSKNDLRYNRHTADEIKSFSWWNIFIAYLVRLHCKMLRIIDGHYFEWSWIHDNQVYIVYLYALGILKICVTWTKILVCACSFHLFSQRSRLTYTQRNMNLDVNTWPIWWEFIPMKWQKIT